MASWNLDADAPWGALQWQKDPPPAEWDRVLAGLGGHPLQSCLWGDARRDLEGIAQHRWLARQDGEPVWMIRVEERRTLAGKIAWAPRGPTGRATELSAAVPPHLEARLKAEGFSLLICDPWIPDIGEAGNALGTAWPKPQTIWIDLSRGKEAVFHDMHKHVRNGIRRAARAGVVVGPTSDPAQIDAFADLCRSISVKKEFELRVTPALIGALIDRSTPDGGVEAVLFVAHKASRFGTGLLILRAGHSVHLIAAGTNRDLRTERVGEACQWGVIEWAIASGCTRYDLEGVDPVNHPSVYEFKKRLGGEEITLHGHAHIPLKLSGRAMSRLIRLGAGG